MKATKVPILFSYLGDDAIVNCCVEENTRRQRHDQDTTTSISSASSSASMSTYVGVGAPSSYAFALTKDGRTMGWDTQSGETTHETRACLPGKRISAMDMYSKMGKTLLFFGTENGQCRALDVDSCQCVTVFKPHPPTSSLNATTLSSNSLGHIVTMSAREGILATGNTMGQTCIWDVTTGRLKRKWSSHNKQAITSIQFDQNESYNDFRQVYTTGQDKSVRIWDIRLKKPQVVCFNSHRNVPVDVTIIDNVVYSCATTSTMSNNPFRTPKTTSFMSLPSLNTVDMLEHRLKADRYFPISSRSNMRDIIRQQLKRTPLRSSNTNDNDTNDDTKIQQSILAGMPQNTNGLRPHGEILLVHDLRSHAVLREINIVDSLTGMKTVSNATMFCAPTKGRRTVAIAGRTHSGQTKACCISIDTGEMLYDLTILPTKASCTSLRSTKSSSSASQIVMGYEDGAFATYSLDEIQPLPTKQNATWREKNLLSALDHTIKDKDIHGISEREQNLLTMLKQIQELRFQCDNKKNSIHWSWSAWQDRLKEMVSQAHEAIALCMTNRSFLTSKELELGAIAAASAGMIAEAMSLMKMHVRTGIPISDICAAKIMDLIPFQYHFGYGSESVPKIKPLQTISIEASVLLGKKCIQTIKASGRIPREDAVSGYIRLLCRCGYVKEALKEREISIRRGIKPGRDVYEALLQALLDSDAKCSEMVELVEEMAKYNIIPTESEFEILFDACIKEKKWLKGKDWLGRALKLNVGFDITTPALKGMACRLLRACLQEYIERTNKRLKSLTLKQINIADNEMITFFVDVMKQCVGYDLKYLMIQLLVKMNRHDDAHRLLLKLDTGEKMPCESDLNSIKRNVKVRKEMK